MSMSAYITFLEEETDTRALKREYVGLVPPDFVGAVFTSLVPHQGLTKYDLQISVRTQEMIFEVLIVKFITCLNRPKIPNSRTQIIRELRQTPLSGRYPHTA